MKKIIILFILALTLVGCSNNNSENSSENKSGNNSETSSTNGNSNGDSKSDAVDNYVFIYSGITIAVEDEAKEILEQLGEPMEYFEAPSCAYQGLDKTYYYNGFEITTYTDNDTDYIANVLLVDDSVTTREGIYIGSSVDEVVNKYGSDYETSVNQYVYTLGETGLQFIFEGDVVISIMYGKGL